MKLWPMISALRWNAEMKPKSNAAVPDPSEWKWIDGWHGSNRNREMKAFLSHFSRLVPINYFDYI